MTTPVASWARSVITGLRWTVRGILLGLGEVWWWIGGATAVPASGTSSCSRLDGRHGLRLPPSDLASPDRAGRGGRGAGVVGQVLADLLPPPRGASGVAASHSAVGEAQLADVDGAIRARTTGDRQGRHRTPHPGTRPQPVGGPRRPGRRSAADGRADRRGPGGGVGTAPDHGRIAADPDHPERHPHRRARCGSCSRIRWLRWWRPGSLRRTWHPPSPRPRWVSPRTGSRGGSRSPCRR